MLLRLKDVGRILDNLHRVRLLPPRARAFFIDIANEMRLPKSEYSSEAPKPTDIPLVDADEVVWKWMEKWGGWDANLVDDVSDVSGSGK